MAKLAVLLALFCSMSEIFPISGEVLLCYYGTWANYRTGNGKCTVNEVEPSAAYCTHLIYTFMGLNTNGSMVSLDEWLDYGLDNFNTFNAIKNKYPNVKTLLAIGGWSEGSTSYSTMAANAALRKTFVESVLYYLKNYGFDGLDVDWEYPAQRGGVTADKENFVSLLKELREAFNQYNYILTAAVHASGSSVDLSYDVPALSLYLDYINVMTYDLHGSWDGVAGHHAPLYASSAYAVDQTLTIDASIQAWLSRGASPSKLVMGLPTYGRTFTLSDPSRTALGSPTSNAGTAGPYTDTAGSLGYNELIEKFAAGGWTIVWDDEQKIPYTYNGNQWVGYDNTDSITAKVNYAASYGLAGVMIWSLETEDFNGSGGTPFPLLSAVKSTYESLNINLDGKSSSDSASKDNSSDNKESATSATSAARAVATTKGTTTTTTTAAPQPTSSSGSFSSNIVTSSIKNGYRTTCPAVGFFRESTKCSVFYQCVSAGAVAVGQQCSSGLVFDLNNNICNWENLVDC